MLQESQWAAVGLGLVTLPLGTSLFSPDKKSTEDPETSVRALSVHHSVLSDSLFSLFNSITLATPWGWEPVFQRRCLCGNAGFPWEQLWCVRWGLCVTWVYMEEKGTRQALQARHIGNSRVLPVSSSVYKAPST